MAQHDGVIDNGPGLAVRTDINAALQAIFTQNSGPVEPATKYPGMLWLDTSVGTDGTLRQRNQANTAWVTVQLGAVTGSPFKRTVFTANSSTFQYDATTLYADIEVVGGGASGGGSGGGSGAGLGSAGSGGGAGGYCKKLIAITAAVRSATKTITVGAGGAASAVAGNNGGTSSYGDTVNSLSSSGGIAGAVGIFNSTIISRPGGSGGAGSAGDVIVGSGAGCGSLSFGSTQCGANASAGNGGSGGSGPLGGGGVGGALTASTSVNSSPGSGGWNYGGGGGGGVGQNGVGAAVAGGAGANGAVIITEYR